MGTEHTAWIGISTHGLVAFQVTSRRDRAKIVETLELVIKHEHNKTFSNGIKMLILNDDPVRLKKKERNVTDILPGFSITRDILSPKELKAQIKEIYEDSLIQFDKILSLLEQELNPFMQIHEKPKTDEPASPPLSILLSANAAPDTVLDISASFFTSDLQPPSINPAAPRRETVIEINARLQEHQFLWIQGSPSNGKTSLAVLISRSVQVSTICVKSCDADHRSCDADHFGFPGRFL